MATIGVGNIGHALVARLIDCGVRVRVWDPSEPARTRAERLGAEVGRSASDAARDADAVILSVPDGAAAEEALLDANGGLESVRQATLIIDMSTNTPATARRLAAESARAGAEFVDAPVSGGPKRARSGELSVMAGGTDFAFARARSLLELLAANVFHVGGSGSGQAMKLVNNLLTAVNLVAIGEAVALGLREGLELSAIHDVVTASSGDSKRFRDSIPRVMRGEVGSDYGHVDILGKDLELAVEAGSRQRLPMPAASIANQIFRVVQAQGNGGRDIEAIIEFYAGLAGVDLTAPARNA